MASMICMGKPHLSRSYLSNSLSDWVPLMRWKGLQHSPLSHLCRTFSSSSRLPNTSLYTTLYARSLMPPIVKYPRLSFSLPPVPPIQGQHGVGLPSGGILIYLNTSIGSFFRLPMLHRVVRRACEWHAIFKVYAFPFESLTK